MNLLGALRWPGRRGSAKPQFSHYLVGGGEVITNVEVIASPLIDLLV